MNAGNGTGAPQRRFTPGPTTLLALFPAAWRRRYGDELDALILDMAADGRDTGTRVRHDLLRSALRERVRGGGDPSRRIRGGASLVLWAWALFVIGGAILAKTSEHWQQALPGVGSAHVAFSVLTVIAFVASAAVAGGILLPLPAVWRLLREGGWKRICRRTVAAAVLSVAVIAATIGLSTWAHGLSAADRNGHDHLYAAAFVGWGALVAACLLAWTSVATRLASEIRCDRLVLRVQAWLAPAVAVAMAMMTAAALVWWVLVGAHAPGALTGGSTLAHPSPVVPMLVLAAALMGVATAVAAVGAARADGARAQL
jgi:MFS family permease